MSDVKRKDGWYWVKLEDFNGWIPWEWRSSSRSPEGLWYNSEKPVEIGPRIPTPDEPWKTVPVAATRGIEDAIAVARSLKASEIWEDALVAAPKP